MAALLLSFGLMMTGCDSGGDSDSDDPINAAEYLEIKDGVTGAAGTAATFTVTVNKPLEATKKATFTKVATAAVEYIGGTGGATAVLQAVAIKNALNDATGAKYTATVGTTAGTDDHIITLTQKTPYGQVEAANKPAVEIVPYNAPPASDRTATITAAEDDTALVVIATGGTLKSNLNVYIKTDGSTPKSTVTVTAATDTNLGTVVSGGVTVTPKTDRLVITGLSVDASGGDHKLASGNNEVKVVLKADAQQSGASGVAAHTHSGTPVVVPPETADPPAYVVVATASAVSAATKIHYASASKVLNYHVTNGSLVTETLDEDFDAALIAVLTVLEATDTIQFGADGVVTDIGVLAASPTAAKVTAALGFADAVTLGDDLSLTADFAVPAGKTLTIAAQKTLTVEATATLDVSAAGAAIVITKHASAGSVILLPKSGSAANGGGAAIKFTAGTAHAQSQGTANSTTVGTSVGAATVFTFAGTTGTDITTLPNASTGEAVIDGELQAATVATDDVSSKGKIVLNGNANNDATISAATEFETSS
jgi:hypothetical protein